MGYGKQAAGARRTERADAGPGQGPVTPDSPGKRTEARGFRELGLPGAAPLARVPRAPPALQAGEPARLPPSPALPRGDRPGPSSSSPGTPFLTGTASNQWDAARPLALPSRARWRRAWAGRWRGGAWSLVTVAGNNAPPSLGGRAARGGRRELEEEPPPPPPPP